MVVDGECLSIPLRGNVPGEARPTQEVPWRGEPLVACRDGQPRTYRSGRIEIVAPDELIAEFAAAGRALTERYG